MVRTPGEYRPQSVRLGPKHRPDGQARIAARWEPTGLRSVARMMQERIAQCTNRADVSDVDPRWRTVIGAGFVLCWASGFVVPRVLVPFAEPLTFVVLRNGGAALVLIAIALALRAEWPRTHANIAGLLWAGACLQGFALMGVYWAVYRGCAVSVAALIGG